MNVNVNLDTDSAIKAQNVAKKIEAAQEQFESLADFEKLLDSLPTFLDNMLVKQALVKVGIKRKIK